MTSVLDTGARFSTVMPGLDPGIHGKKSCEDPDCTVIRAALDVSRKYSAFCQGCGIFCQDGRASPGYGWCPVVSALGWPDRRGPAAVL